MASGSLTAGMSWWSMAALRKNAARASPAGGKSSTNGARYRYVLQLSVIGPEGTLFPLMHEEMDLHNPQTQKEDCELKSFQRLSQRLKKEFPKLPICLVADALYACQPIVAICQRFDWKYVLTLKEGRQPTTWDETIKLLPFNRTNRARHLLGAGGKAGLQDFRWVEHVMLGEHQTNVILLGRNHPRGGHPLRLHHQFLKAFARARGHRGQPRAGGKGI